MIPWAAGLFSTIALAAPSDDAAPAAPGDFGQYLVDHQADLAPFFAKNSGAFVAAGVPLVLEWMGSIMFVTLLVGWALDLAMGRGYAALFAPSRASWPRAIVYATGRLALSVLLTVLLGVAIIPVAGAANLAVILLVLFGLFVLITAGAQVTWIAYLYRTDIFISVLFYITLIVIHGFIALSISVPLVGSRAGKGATDFVDQTITPRVKAEAQDTRRQLAIVAGARDQSVSQVAEAQDQLDAARAEQVEVQKEIEEQKNSPGYLFSQIVKLHAQGDLAGAHARFTDFLSRFSSGPLAGLAKGQLIQVDNEIAAEAAQKQQAAADAAKAAAQARADLLARAARGEVTLSEMRNVLVGKTRDQVRALLGPPTETASDRWGFGQQMIVNPLTNAKSGLAVYFSEGFVQGVDYYTAP